MDDRYYQRSEAFIPVMALMPLPWKLATIVWIIPVPLRDWLYDRIALNRYRLFGKLDVCLLPQSDYEGRFI
ncbi:MAG: putative DCC family thiol-disulfide oxidoreductase YuxK [Gammaproteobacteria bacterium]|jgi:predicted DCC family thiol-disulfide oxidoreductase YuxK